VQSFLAKTCKSMALRFQMALQSTADDHAHKSGHGSRRTCQSLDLRAMEHSESNRISIYIGMGFIYAWYSMICSCVAHTRLVFTLELFEDGIDDLVGLALPAKIGSQVLALEEHRVDSLVDTGSGLGVSKVRK
jgi:hypothetical protein